MRKIRSSQQLQAEKKRLKQEIKALRQQVQLQQESADALLLMLEDLNSLHEDLEHAKSHWEATFDAIHDPIFLHDSQGQVIRANHAYARVAGKSFDEILNRPYWHSFPLQSDPLPGCQAASGTQHSCTEAIIPFEAQGRQYLSFSYPVPDHVNGEPCFVHVLQDVTVQQQSHTQLATRTNELRHTLEATVQVMARTVEMRDPYTAGHQRRVANLGTAIGHKLGLDAECCEGIYYGGIIHDLGKITLPAEILAWPGRLSPLQYALVQEHPQVGYDILSGIDFPWPVADIVHQHHERLDGSGYPQGLAGEDIALEARVIAIADVVEAMAMHRPYRAGLGIEVALAEIQSGRGQRYEADAVDACVELVRRDGFQFDAPSAENHTGSCN